MATLAQARAALAKLGLHIDESVSGWHRNSGGLATIDVDGRGTIGTDCRGHSVFDYTATRAEFWQMVIDEATSDVAPFVGVCPHPVGECDFHDEAE